MSTPMYELYSKHVRDEITWEEFREQIVKLRAQQAKQLPLTGAEGLAILIGEAIGEDVQTYTRDANKLTVTAQDGCTYGVTVHLIEECIPDTVRGSLLRTATNSMGLSVRPATSSGTTSLCKTPSLTGCAWTT